MSHSTFVLAGAATALFVSTATAVDLHMIHATRGNMAVGVFTPTGPQLGTMQKAPSRLDYVTFDAGTGTWFGQTVGTLGVIDDGTLAPVEAPESVDLSHAGGLAYDAQAGSVIVASRSGAGTELFEYTPATDTWNAIGNIGRDDFHGLACDGAQGLFYTLDKPRQGNACTNLRVFNRSGAQVQAIDLASPIPVLSQLRPKVQLTFAGSTLFAMVSAEESHPRSTTTIYAINRTDGGVSRTPYNADVDLTTATWPGWTDGPSPSAPMAACGAEGDGDFSNYRTPDALVSGQDGELHVVAIHSGATSHLEWMKKVRGVGVSTNGDGGVSVAVELDADAEVRHPVVEVVVGKTAKPATLALVSGSAVTWSITAAPGAEIAKVVTFGNPYISGCEVVGVDPALVAEGGNANAAYAWELDRSSGPAFDAMIETVRTRTGLRESTFQGMPRATAFLVPVPATAGRQASAERPDH